MDLHTFSIAAYCPEEGSFGVAVSTARPNVGSLVPFVGLEGAIATQARVNTDLGRHGLALLRAGIGIEIALNALLQADEDRAIRQLHGVDREGAFAFTGEQCVEWAGHRIGDHYTVAGNMLTGPEVIDAMAEAYEAARAEGAELSERLLRALEAGQAAGGDKRGKQSAALLVASPDPRWYHNLRVDDHADPVAELRRIYDLVVEHSKQIEQEYGMEGLRLFSKIKW
ncbi:MAG TPA: DUF1028 domain-containing protein [Caldilineae bacterium]|nr:DUF1028 domain-containing protein [Caldilineae bacterium]